MGRGVGGNGRMARGGCTTKREANTKTKCMLRDHVHSDREGGKEQGDQRSSRKILKL